MYPSEADKAVPQPLLDSYQFIEEIFGARNWQRTLKKEAALLESCFKKQDKEIKMQDKNQMKLMCAMEK